jgi:hypothetical protein
MDEDASGFELAFHKLDFHTLDVHTHHFARTPSLILSKIRQAA